MHNLPTVENIVDTLAFPPKFREDFRRELAPYYRLIGVKDTVQAIKAGAIIEALHPKQKVGAAYRKEAKYKENQAYDAVVCAIIYWWFNVKNKTSAVKQKDFVFKQRRDLKDIWPSIVVYSHHPASKTLILDCLREELGAVNILTGIKDYSEFWGEPAKFIPADEIVNWPSISREIALILVTLSKDENFKKNIAEALYNDPDKRLRNYTRQRIDKGELPNVPKKIQDALKKPKPTKLDRQKTKAMWIKFKVKPFPIVWNANKLKMNLYGIDTVIRNTIEELLVSEIPSETVACGVLEAALKNLDIWIDGLPPYFTELREVAVRVLNESRDE